MTQLDGPAVAEMKDTERGGGGSDISWGLSCHLKGHPLLPLPPAGHWAPSHSPDPAPPPRGLWLPAGSSTGLKPSSKSTTHEHPPSLPPAPCPPATCWPFPSSPVSLGHWRCSLRIKHLFPGGLFHPEFLGRGTLPIRGKACMTFSGFC